MNFFHHKDLGNHLLQLCPKVVKHPVYVLFPSLRPVITIITICRIIMGGPHGRHGKDWKSRYKIFVGDPQRR
jgi:hypothetical protein